MKKLKKLSRTRPTKLSRRPSGTLETAVIIAAGRGERLRPLTDSVPKPLIDVAGRSMIDRIVERLNKGGIRHVYYSLGYKWDAVLRHIQEEPGLQRSFRGSFIDESLPGTAYWIYTPLVSRFDAPVVVSTADNLMTVNLKSLAQEYVKLGRPACLMVPIRAGDHSGTRLEFDASTRRVLRADGQKADPQALIASGLQVINPKKIAALSPQSRRSFEEVWTDLIKVRQLFVSRHLPVEWVAIDDLDHLHRVRASLSKIAASLVSP